jgi:hypothetical protein
MVLSSAFARGGDNAPNGPRLCYPISLTKCDVGATALDSAAEFPTIPF